MLSTQHLMGVGLVGESRRGPLTKGGGSICHGGDDNSDDGDGRMIGAREQLRRDRSKKSIYMTHMGLKEVGQGNRVQDVCVLLSAHLSPAQRHLISDKGVCWKVLQTGWRGISRHLRSQVEWGDKWHLLVVLQAPVEVTRVAK